ncbi:MAG: SLC45 family MFS transporter [Muribaculaceae bacterium]|nr:SLC45 family MFS transporter [Muribaculaceae bacterium]
MEKDKPNATPKLQSKPDLGFSKLWNISFGFFGVQIAYALQSANISRIFSTLGADPHSLSFFWILPPLMGMIVQPLVGYFSDKTWTRFGRRIPYLFAGAAIAVAVMCLLPNAGSFGFTVASAMIFGAVMLMLLDTSINMAMQPFKMMVGDMVNEKQKAKAYSIQSFLCNAGSIVGYLFPLIFTAIGVANVAEKGQVPDSVKWAFYIGSAILILCVIFTTAKVKEYTPEQMAQFQAAANAEKAREAQAKGKTKDNNAMKVFLQVGVVQFFCWAAFMFMWTYTNGSIADTVWNTTDAASEAYQHAGNWVGTVFAVQAIGSVLWAVVLPFFKNIKVGYALSLVIGGIGFAMVPFVTDKYVLFVPYFLIGCAWAAMLAMPFTLVTNALEGSKRMGTYLGLFNCTICIPQIVAAIAGGGLMILMHNLLPTVSEQGNMLLLAGVFLLIGAACVFFISERKHLADK